MRCAASERSSAGVRSETRCAQSGGCAATTIPYLTTRLQASSVDMDQTLIRAAELAKRKGDYVTQSTYETASGRTEITVRRHSPVIWIVLGVVGLIVFLVLKATA